ncbi:MAG: metal-dependent phosphohydrolase [Porticoccaceae bacterium]|nr:MAG: metal-dependent phosphohydrolase [Porticoccaceae bacterium]
MALVKIPAMQLKPGMFVAELDRPWLETPFALQGFVVRDDEDVLYIAQYVEYVYVDPAYSGGAVFLPTRDRQRAVELKRRDIKADFQQARVDYDSAQMALEQVFHSLEQGGRLPVKQVKSAVRPIIDDVFRNRDAMAALARLKKIGDYRYHHGLAMAVWAALLGKHIGLSRDELEKLVLGCALCDVGMTRLPPELVNKAGGYDAQERARMHEHPRLGVELLAETGDVDPEVLAVVEHHHERHDGSGYPRGLAGTAIPLFARIAGLVDSFDAMISPRPHAAPRTSFAAMQEILDAKGQLFQDELVEQFLQAVGLFPIGALVELNTGEVGVVVRQNPHRRLKPEIVVLLGSDKRPREKPLLLDLARQSLAEKVWIERELPQGSYGLDGEEFFSS